MINLNRRGLILGGSSFLVVAPVVVRASSLMPLRGYELDPWVVVYGNRESAFNYSESVGTYGLYDHIVWSRPIYKNASNGGYSIKRLSEIKEATFACENYKGRGLTRMKGEVLARKYPSLFHSRCVG
jgi:hypothetical protein